MSIIDVIAIWIVCACIVAIVEIIKDKNNE